MARLFIGVLGMTNVLLDETPDRADMGVGALVVEGVTEDGGGSGG